MSEKTKTKIGCMFIGGIWDGEVIQVDPDSAGVELSGEKYNGFSLTAIPLQPSQKGSDMLSVRIFVKDDVAPDTIVERVTKGYWLQKRKGKGIPKNDPDES